MENAERRRVRKALDALLREAPDRIRRVLEEGELTATLEQLRETENPGPDWIRDKARNIRFKCGCARAGLGELADELRAARTAWTETGGEDPLRLSQTELVLKQIEAKTEELSAVRQNMKALIVQADRAEESAEQADLLAALAQLRSFEKEAAE